MHGPYPILFVCKETKEEEEKIIERFNRSEVIRVGAGEAMERRGNDDKLVLKAAAAT